MTVKCPVLNGMLITTAAPVPKVGNIVREEGERVWELEYGKEWCEIQTSEYGVDTALKLIAWDAEEQAIHNSSMGREGVHQQPPLNEKLYVVDGYPERENPFSSCL